MNAETRMWGFSQKGAATRLSLPARVDGLEPVANELPPRAPAGHLSGSDRVTRCPVEEIPPRSSRLVRTTLEIASIMCTGMRMVRAWSAIERVIACRIHQVA